MSRTTIMADDALLDRLREIAKEEDISLGEVIRQGLEWRAQRRRRPPSFIGAVSSGTTDTSSRVDELIAEAVLAKHDRIRAEWQADQDARR